MPNSRLNSATEIGLGPRITKDLQIKISDPVPTAVCTTLAERYRIEYTAESADETVTLPASAANSITS